MMGSIPLQKRMRLVGASMQGRIDQAICPLCSCGPFHGDALRCRAPLSQEVPLHQRSGLHEVYRLVT
jgi:hypothetical protein